MARRNDHMLEAFQVSREQAIAAQREALAPPAESIGQRLQRSLGRKPEEPLAKAPNAPSQPTPGRFPAAAQPSTPRPLVDYSSPSPLHEEETGLRVSPWTLLGFSVTLAGLSFVLGWQVGRIGRVAAATPVARPASDGNGLQQLPDPGAWPGQPTPAVADEGTLDPADIAFQDPSNHYTLVVDQYNDNALGRERAIAHYLYLRGQGFPVVRPRLRGDVVYLLVGAAGDREALGSLLSQVQVLPYPGSQDRTFSTAYLERIEDFF